MPWRNTTVEEERLIFVKKVLKRARTVVELCEKYNISTKTTYKWLNRYYKNGEAGLKDASRSRKTQAEKISTEIKEVVVKIRIERRSLGPKKIQTELLER